MSDIVEPNQERNPTCEDRWKQRCGDLVTWLEGVIRPAESGWLIVTTGRDPYLTATGKYKHCQWNENPFRWPEQAQEAALFMLAEAEEADVYCCPYLMTEPKRRKGQAVSHRLVHTDVDGLIDLQKVDELGGFVVASATPGHGHAYTRLTRSVSADQHEALCKGQVAYLRGDPGKCSDNDVLRPAGTFNHKPTVSGGRPAAVMLMNSPPGSIDPNELASKLGVDLARATVAANGHQRSSVMPAPNGSERVNLASYPKVHKALRLVTTDPPDRSVDAYRVLFACYDAGLSPAQGESVLRKRADLGDWLDENPPDELDKTWAKIEDRQFHDAEPVFDGDPIPLTQTVTVPPWPVDALPKPIADMVNAVAEATQTDPAMPATSALSALSACTGGHAEIEIRSGWREPLCVYTATIAAPGERKSAVQMFMTRPIHEVERLMVADSAADRMAAEERKQVATKAVERQRTAAARAEGDDAQREAFEQVIGAAAIADGIEVPPVPRLLADDITPEAAASLLAEQGGRLAIISAEGGIFDIIAGRYSPKASPNMDLWLKGHSGDPLRVDRKGRPPEHIPRPALTLGLMIQPTVLGAIAANHQFRGRGFLARILYARPMSKVGHRKTPAPPVDPEVERNYMIVVMDLARGMRGWVGDPALLTLTEGAQQEIQRIEAAVEPTLARDGELASLADWGGKYLGAVARIAGILHLAEHGADKGPRKTVSAQTIMAAARIGEYLKAAAINAFAEMGTDQGTADAVYLLERIRHLGQDEVSERDLHVASRSRFKTKADLKPALNRLVDHGFLAPLPVPKQKGAGRPGSPRYRVSEGRTETIDPTER